MRNCFIQGLLLENGNASPPGGAVTQTVDVILGVMMQNNIKTVQL